ncbi:hypothetical protein Mgra_00008312 [Meloidogyne graminicola]|uniref:Uncharacterized protein n=1 Tax=Meloidogyne graminicola TaxID=189291 RepID=A0A8S9ZG57_9BILA|nr:hypothetical protein Mgra_00008312 [Meloidogyne graminicola]
MIFSVNSQFCTVFFPQVCPLICKACTGNGCLATDQLCIPGIEFCRFFGCPCAEVQ